MNIDIMRQRDYWNKEVRVFDSIYSHEKSKLGNILDSVFRWDMYKRYEYSLENAEPIQERTFLDVGCGTGRYALDLARRNALKVVGIDISDSMIQVCQQRARIENLHDRTMFLQTDLLEYRPETKFDVTIGIGLFDYIKDPLSILGKMHQVTNSCVILSFPRMWSLRAPIRKIRLMLKGCDVYFYDLKGITKLLGDAGFGKFKCRRIGQLFCVTAFPK